MTVTTRPKPNVRKSVIEPWERALRDDPEWDRPSMFGNWRFWLVLAACAGLWGWLVWYTFPMWSQGL